MQITYLIIAYIQDINNTDLKLQPPKTSIVKKPNKKGGGHVNRHFSKDKRRANKHMKRLFDVTRY